MLKINTTITPQDLVPKAERLFELSAKKIRSIEDSWDDSRGTPVFTVKGQYSVQAPSKTQGIGVV